jgi:hypothetical protein
MVKSRVRQRRIGAGSIIQASRLLRCCRTRNKICPDLVGNPLHLPITTDDGLPSRPIYGPEFLFSVRSRGRLIVSPDRHKARVWRASPCDRPLVTVGSSL